MFRVVSPMFWVDDDGAVESLLSMSSRRSTLRLYFHCWQNSTCSRIGSVPVLSASMLVSVASRMSARIAARRALALRALLVLSCLLPGNQSSTTTTARAHFYRPSECACTDSTAILWPCTGKKSTA